MAYQTYITEAIVCGSRASNTSDGVFLLFTRDAGMIHAHARSVREEKSKHRYALQPFSYLRITLVRGKGGWRIIGTESIQNFYSETSTREARSFLRNTTILLRRVMRGETAHPEIFDDIICANMQSNKQNPEKLEQILFLRTLNTLGYVPPQPLYESLLTSDIPYDNVGELSMEVTNKCKDAVEYALQQSQL